MLSPVQSAQLEGICNHPSTLNSPLSPLLALPPTRSPTTTATSPRRAQKGVLDLSTCPPTQGRKVNDKLRKQALDVISGLTEREFCLRHHQQGNTSACFVSLETAWERWSPTATTAKGHNEAKYIHNLPPITNRLLDRKG